MEGAMKIAILCVLLSLCLALPADARGESTRWVTFKTARLGSYGPVLYQIDRTTIAQQGPYKAFSARIWVVAERQPLVFSTNEQMFFLWQKYAVDCARRRFGSRFVDSNDPKAKKTSLQSMIWTRLDKTPAVAQLVCGGK
jgi:hypothetical protein